MFDRNQDSLFLSVMTLRRLQLEIEMLGASVSCEVTGNITHVIIYIPSESSTVIIRRIEQRYAQGWVLTENRSANCPIFGRLKSYF